MRATVLLVALLGAPGALADADPAAVACHAFVPDADYVEHTIVMDLEGREVRLRVPVQYFEDPWDRRDGFRDTAQLFVVEIGSFEPVTRREEAERNEQGIWNWMHFVVGDYVDLQRLAVIGADLFAPPDTPVETYAMRSGPHGLAWLDTPYASDKADARSDVFVNPASIRH